MREYPVLTYLNISRAKFAVIFALAFISGLTNTMLVVTINHMLQFPQAETMHMLFIGFVVVLLAYIASQYFAHKLLVVATEKSFFDMRDRNARRLIDVSLLFLEQYGYEKIVAHLTKDLSVLNNAFPNLINLLIATVTVLSALFYLAYLSFSAFLFTIIFLGIGVYLYVRITSKSIGNLSRARETEDIFLRHLTHLIKGSKELKLNRLRAEKLYEDDILKNIEYCFENRSAAKIQFSIAGLIGNSLFFLLIGAVALLSTILPFGAESDRVAFLIVLVFLIGPISRIVLSIPSIQELWVSLDNVQRFEEQLDDAQEKLIKRPSETGFERWRAIHFVGVTYEYGVSEESPFVLGPLNLTFRQGETVFIIGGNGSGKSTLGKLLTGLYQPEKGCVKIDDTMIGPSNRQEYRRLFTSVFSDYYLFDKLHGIDSSISDGDLDTIIDKLQLPSGVITDGEYARLHTLSHGQRKRLALATSYLEDRQIFFFDEWASDQDPIFKDYFYNCLLSELKRCGKTIIAITHDDRYAGVADRIVKLESGRECVNNKEVA